MPDQPRSIGISLIDNWLLNMGKLKVEVQV